MPLMKLKQTTLLFSTLQRAGPCDTWRRMKQRCRFPRQTSHTRSLEVAIKPSAQTGADGIMPERVLLNYHCLYATSAAWIVILYVITFYISDGVLTYIAMR